MIDNSSAIIKSPITAMVSGCNISALEPSTNASGSMPNIATSEVIFERSDVSLKCAVTHTQDAVAKSAQHGLVVADKDNRNTRFGRRCQQAQNRRRYRSIER